MRWIATAAVLPALAFASCNNSSSQSATITVGDASTSTCTATSATPAAPAGPAAPASLTDATTAPKQITFYGDLLPILNSVETGAVYKCTTCHANYQTPDGMNSQDELNSVIQSMVNGTMPRSGQAVPAALIDEFRTWGNEGFPPGDPSSTPKTLVLPPGVAASSADANPCGGSSGGAAPGTLGGGKASF